MTWPMVARTLVSALLCLLCFLAGRRYERRSSPDGITVMWNAASGVVSVGGEPWYQGSGMAAKCSSMADVIDSLSRRAWALENSSTEDRAMLERCQWELKQARGGMPKRRDHKYEGAR